MRCVHTLISCILWWFVGLTLMVTQWLYLLGSIWYKRCAAQHSCILLSTRGLPSYSTPPSSIQLFILAHAYACICTCMYVCMFVRQRSCEIYKIFAVMLMPLHVRRCTCVYDFDLFCYASGFFMPFPIILRIPISVFASFFPFCFFATPNSVWCGHTLWGRRLWRSIVPSIVG